MYYPFLSTEKGTCLEECTKCTEGGQYCPVQCTDISKYVECQSTCIEPNTVDQKKFFGNSASKTECSSKCENLWPGILNKHTNIINAPK